MFYNRIHSDQLEFSLIGQYRLEFLANRTTWILASYCSWATPTVRYSLHIVVHGSLMPNGISQSLDKLVLTMHGTCFCHHHVLSHGTLSHLASTRVDHGYIWDWFSVAAQWTVYHSFCIACLPHFLFLIGKFTAGFARRRLETHQVILNREGIKTLISKIKKKSPSFEEPDKLFTKKDNFLIQIKK